MPSRREDREALDKISKRAQRQEQAVLDSFATSNINPLNQNQNFWVTNKKLLAYTGLEAAHNTFFHFIETVKVRAQARNTVSGDISKYFEH